MIGTITFLIFVLFIFFVVVTVLHKIGLFKLLFKVSSSVSSELRYEKSRKREIKRLNLLNKKSYKVNNEL